MKKILCLALALLMIVVMATACKKDKDDANGDNTTPNYNSYETNEKGEYESNVIEETDDTLVECEQEVVYVINALRSPICIPPIACSRRTIP